MAETAMISARVEPKLKHDAENVFATLGLSPTEAITLFYQQTALHNGLPFELRIPTDETLAAVRQVRSGKGISTVSSVEEMRADLLKDAVNCAARHNFCGTIVGSARSWDSSGPFGHRTAD